jgi:hypothetical protein
MLRYVLACWMESVEWVAVYVTGSGRISVKEPLASRHTAEAPRRTRPTYTAMLMLSRAIVLKPARMRMRKAQRETPGQRVELAVLMRTNKLQVWVNIVWVDAAGVRDDGMFKWFGD